MDHQSLPAMHRASCARYGPRAALRYKSDGLYHDVSWNDYRRQADAAAAALLELGIEPGDRIGILSENRFEWLVADIAILTAGAIDVPMHAPLSPQQVSYQLGHSESRGVFVSNQAQADKVFQVLDELPKIEFVVSFDAIVPSRPIRHWSWIGLQHGSGRRQDQARLRERERSICRDDLATIIYTSGTTGPPKGVMLTHGNLLSNAEATGQISDVDQTDILLSWLPYSHIYARTVDHYLTTLLGLTVCLAESVDTLLANLQQVRPTWMTSVPRVYEKIWCVLEGVEASKRRETLTQLLGGRMRLLCSGGAPLPKAICQGINDAGAPLHEGYGLTESSPVISFNRSGHFKPGSVGLPIPGVEVRIAADGEILTRGPHVMKGYWKNESATNECIVDGWLHTGDVGHLDEDGYLFITDRKKDLIVTSSGKNIAPTEIERLLVSDPAIEQAVVYGDGRHFLTALLVPNAAELERLATQRSLDLHIENEFIANAEVVEFYSQRVERALQDVSSPEKVRKFLLLARPFRVDEGELTATLKLRRREIVRKYQHRLDELYRC